MKKALFIDRDGTLIIEPQTDYQIDSFEKLKFIPNVISNLRKITEELDYELVMVTNQDGLGTDVFPEGTFWPPHQLMLQTFENEGIHFASVHIDRSFEHENLPTRKPGTGMLGQYLTGDYDLANSFTIGDRLTDLILAQNLGAKGILFNPPNIPAKTPTPELESVTALVTDSWNKIYEFFRLPPRKAVVERVTKETQIKIELNLDGKGRSEIHTGVGFYDHMLDQLAKHSGADLFIRVSGDLHIDEHHTVEDTAIALGEAYLKALGDKKGISRYGFWIPMDDALARVAIDFSGRPWLVWNAKFKREKIGDLPTEMFYHFFKSFSDASKCNLNVKVKGKNEHHKIEAIFKAFAKAIKMAVRRDIKEIDSLPSTKGVL
ncbi:MAG: bifunctional histidinol-phosphatase/imidazoleglycerol-phosphate dehydratase HisB [Spirosomataceae bacterium]